MHTFLQRPSLASSNAGESKGAPAAKGGRPQAESREGVPQSRQDLRKGTKDIPFLLLEESKRSKWHGEQQTTEHEERRGAWGGEKFSPCHYWGLMPTAGVRTCLLMTNLSWLDVSPCLPYHYLIARPCCFNALKASANKVVLFRLQQKQPEILIRFSAVPFFGPSEPYAAQMTLLPSAAKQPSPQKQNGHEK